MSPIPIFYIFFENLKRKMALSTVRKFPAGPGEATENQFTFASGGWGSRYPPDPH
jgi:hypothetical protein